MEEQAALPPLPEQGSELTVAVLPAVQAVHAVLLCMCIMCSVACAAFQAAADEIIWHAKHYTGRGVMKFYPSGEDLAKDMGVPLQKIVDAHQKHFEAAKKQDPGRHSGTQRFLHYKPRLHTGQFIDPKGSSGLGGRLPMMMPLHLEQDSCTCLHSSSLISPSWWSGSSSCHESAVTHDSNLAMTSDFLPAFTHAAVVPQPLHACGLVVQTTCFAVTSAKVFFFS